MRLHSRLPSLRAFALASVAGLFAIADDVIEWWSRDTPFDLGWPDLIAFLAIFVIALFGTTFAARSEREERRRLRAIQEVHHHVRNALQVVRLHEQLGSNPSTRAYVDEAIERIEWVMREVLPAVGAPGVEAPESDGPPPSRARADG